MRITCFVELMYSCVLPNRIEAKDANHYTCTGIASVSNSGETIRVTELPVGRWTQDYKQMLVSMVSISPVDRTMRFKC